MKQLITYTAALIFVTLTSVQADEISDLATAGQWISRAQSVEGILNNAIGDTTRLDNISVALTDGEITTDFAVIQAGSIIQAIRRNLSGARIAYERLLPIPELNYSPVAQSGLQIRAKYIKTLLDNIEILVNTSQEIFQAAVEGDQTVQNQLDIKQINQFLAMLHHENAALRMQLSLIKQDHPQYWLVNTIISTNNSIASVLNGTLKIYAGNINITDEIFNARTNLSSAEDGIRTGREVKRKAKIHYRNLKSTTKQEKNMKIIVLSMMDTYPSSFNTEQNIVDIVYETLSLMELSLNLEVIQEDYGRRFDVIFIELDAYMAERIRLQSDREYLLQKLQ